MYYQYIGATLEYSSKYADWALAHFCRRLFHALYTLWKSVTEMSLKTPVQAAFTVFRFSWLRFSGWFSILGKEKSLQRSSRDCREEGFSSVTRLPCSMCDMERYRGAATTLQLFLVHSIDLSLQSSQHFHIVRTIHFLSFRHKFRVDHSFHIKKHDQYCFDLGFGNVSFFKHFVPSKHLNLW